MQTGHALEILSHYFGSGNWDVISKPISSQCLLPQQTFSRREFRSFLEFENHALLWFMNCSQQLGSGQDKLPWEALTVYQLQTEYWKWKDCWKAHTLHECSVWPVILQLHHTSVKFSIAPGTLFPWNWLLKDVVTATVLDGFKRWWDQLVVSDGPSQLPHSWTFIFIGSVPLDDGW